MSAVVNLHHAVPAEVCHRAGITPGFRFNHYPKRLEQHEAYNRLLRNTAPWRGAEKIQNNAFFCDNPEEELRIMFPSCADTKSRVKRFEEKWIPRIPLHIALLFMYKGEMNEQEFRYLLKRNKIRITVGTIALLQTLSQLAN